MTDHYVVIALESSIIRIGYTVQYQMLKLILEYVSPLDYIVSFSKVLASILVLYTMSYQIKWCLPIS